MDLAWFAVATIVLGGPSQMWWLELDDRIRIDFCCTLKEPVVTKLMPLTAGMLAFLLVLSPTWAEEISPSDEEADESTELAQTEEPAAAETGDALGSSSVAEQLDEASSVTVEESSDEASSGTLISPFSLGFGMTYSVGAGTIFRDEATTTDYHLLTFSFSANYATPVPTLGVFLSWSLSKFLTDPGGSTYQREARAGDLTLGAAWGSFFYDEKYTGLNFSANLALRFPTSEASRFTDLILGLPFGIGISRSFGNLNLRYSLGVSKNFHQYTSTVADLDSYEIQVIARDGGRENIGDALIALDTGLLGEWNLSNSLSLSYTWIPGLSSAIGFSIRNSWSYDNGTITEADQYTAEYAETGRGRVDIMTGTISTSYSFLEYFTTSIALSTSQMPFTADNESLRFPWLDLETGNFANTELSLSLDITY